MRRPDKTEHEAELKQRIIALVNRAIAESGLTKREIPRGLTGRDSKGGSEHLRAITEGEYIPRISTLSMLLDVTGYELVLSMRKADPETEESEAEAAE